MSKCSSSDYRAMRGLCHGLQSRKRVLDLGYAMSSHAYFSSSSYFVFLALFLRSLQDPYLQPYGLTGFWPPLSLFGYAPSDFFLKGMNHSSNQRKNCWS
ncbi:hypothetical protein BCR34DRAFT_232485 [Clohesyomyces aquaticus]|uniref:Uncharacterized protein n=1 Tax=Clohesyomyces aquaticus TaxID=1231657 RepID=A0A1Y1ZVX6_9PLEO|nr:hypothetical protein BCR34DRAFT_232485 [Clohesyomyces aquaticus]